MAPRPTGGTSHRAGSDVALMPTGGVSVDLGRLPWRGGTTLRWLVGSASLGFIIWSSVLPAARHIETDFSNYYIPARLIARGESTARLYEFSWFQRQMEYAGIHDALGGFNYFPPPAALPLVPLGGLDSIAAKTLWTIANLVMLLALLWVLRRLGGLPFTAGLALAALSGSSLRDNFLFGQFYIALSLSIAVALLLLRNGRSGSAGVLLGVATAVKVYPAPLLAYLVIRREWRGVAGFAAGFALTYAVSVSVLGWPLHEHYVASILPASLAGQTDSPYDPELQSWTSVLRVLLVHEPTLNAHPFMDAPFLFHLARDASLLGLLSLLLCTIRDHDGAPPLTLMVLVLPLLSTSVFSYHAFLAVIPIGCWLARFWQQRRWGTVAMAGALYVFATSPLAGGWPVLHLRLSALAALFFLLLREVRPWRLPPAVAAVVVTVSVVHSVWAARQRTADGAVPVAWDAPHLESPAVAGGVLVYSALGCAGCARYQLRGTVPPGVPSEGHQLAPAFTGDGKGLFVEIAAHGRSRVALVRAGSANDWSPEDLSCQQPAASNDGTRMVAVCDGRLRVFEAAARSRVLPPAAGDVADPTLSPDGSHVAFARLTDGHWHLYELAPGSDALHPLVTARGDERGPRYSPDGARLVFSRRDTGWDALWLRDLVTGEERRLSRGTGNDNQPTWSDDGRSIYFASDRGRGIFMPAVYRLDLP